MKTATLAVIGVQLGRCRATVAASGSVFTNIGDIFLPNAVVQYLKVLHRTGRANKIVVDSVHVLCDQPYT